MMTKSTALDGRLGGGHWTGALRGIWMRSLAFYGRRYLGAVSHLGSLAVLCSLFFVGRMA